MTKKDSPSIKYKWLHENSTSSTGNGFSKAQLAVLGIEWPPQKGWALELMGRPIPIEVKLEFESYRHTSPKDIQKMKNPKRCPHCGKEID